MSNKTQHSTRPPARANEEIAGHYVTDRDGGLLYDYEAFWTSVGDRIFWSAKILRNGQPKGQPVGVIRMMGQTTAREAVRKLVEFSIENLNQVNR